MPELPDVTNYVEALKRFIVGKRIEKIQVRSPFVVRTFSPPIAAAQDRVVTGIQRVAKRIVWELGDDLFLIFHLMIAGRFHWRKPGTQARGKIDLIAFQFDCGVLMLTEASPKKRAAVYVVASVDEVKQQDPGGLDVLDCDAADFRAALLRENHTLKRALTDPHLFDGIGNAYSDEILHGAGLSPLKWTSRLADDEITRLYESVQRTLHEWIDRLREETGDRFPENVTAFRPGMAVHGRFKEPCPVCGTPVQRIVYAENECNYCPSCQTQGKLLADRSLSRLLKDDWPDRLEEE